MGSIQILLVYIIKLFQKYFFTSLFFFNLISHLTRIYIYVTIFLATPRVPSRIDCSITKRILNVAHVFASIVRHFRIKHHLQILNVNKKKFKLLFVDLTLHNLLIIFYMAIKYLAVNCIRRISSSVL